MSALLKVNVSPRTALIVIALALLCASVVGGREARPPAPPPPLAPEPQAREAPPPDLELDRLARPGLGEPLANLFASPRAATAPRAARPAPPPLPAAPVAPPAPLRYVGRILEEDEIAVFVAPTAELLLAVPGATLGGQYQVQEVTPAALTLVYLPLGTRQVVPIPARD
jgi:hypothetical protein